MVETYRQKIMDLPGALKRRREVATDGRLVVFTNGCFDLLHPGHLRYLAQARSLGDYLIVGLNSDSSVGSIKGEVPIGPPRPVCSQEVRAEMLAALTMVDAVVIFDEDTPLGLICALEPDFLVKGGDWPVEKIVGAQVVTNRGGKVLSLPLADGFSSTALINHILGHG